jgi:hypothetical protein
LVIDWSSLTKRTVDKVPIRVAVLRELVRVTHPTGRVWLAFTRRALNQFLLDEWCSVLERNEYQLVRELTGWVEAIDHQDKPFAFWSLCFCPEGKPLMDVRRGEFALTFERDRVVLKRGKEGNRFVPASESQPVRHEQFVVKTTARALLSARQAAQAAIVAEKARIARMANIPWRSWQEMQRRGIPLDLS